MSRSTSLVYPVDLGLLDHLLLLLRPRGNRIVGWNCFPPCLPRSIECVNLTRRTVARKEQARWESVSPSSLSSCYSILSTEQEEQEEEHPADADEMNFRRVPPDQSSRFDASVGLASLLVLVPLRLHSPLASWRMRPRRLPRRLVTCRSMPWLRRSRLRYSSL